MTKQILKGWVRIDEYDVEKTIYLLKGNDTEEFEDKRQLTSLLRNVMEHLKLPSQYNDEDSEEHIHVNYYYNNIQMQLFASSEGESLDNIKEKIVLDSMGLLNLKIGWYGYSEWTIAGFDIRTFKLGGHDILNIIRGLRDKYIYLVIDQLED